MTDIHVIRKSHAPKDEKGVTGLVEFNGVIHEEFLRDLQGDKAIEKYKEMHWNSSIVGAMVRSITMLARQVEWWWTPAEEDTSFEVQEFVEGAHGDMSTDWHDILAEVLTGIIVYGWDYREIVYKTRNGVVPGSPGKSSKFDDGKIGWRKWAERSQDSRARWEFVESDQSLLGMWQLQKMMKDVFIPLEKSLLFRAERYKNSPEGMSMLRSAYRAWYFLKKIEEIEGIGVERDLAGLPVAWVPAEITNSAGRDSGQTAAYQAFQDLVRNVRNDSQAGLVLPMAYDDDNNPMYKFELLSTSSRRNFDTNQIIERYDARIAVTVLADFLLIGHEGVGSFALSSDKTSMFMVAMGTLLDSVANVVNRHAVPRLLAFNGIPLNKSPTLEHGKLDTSSIKDDADSLVKLANAGMILFPDEELENSIRSKAGWPKQDQETREELLRAREDEKAEMKQRLSERDELDSQGGSRSQENTDGQST